MKIGSVAFIGSISEGVALPRSYFVVISGAGESPSLKGFGVASAIALNSDTPEFPAGHLIVESASADRMVELLLQELRILPGNSSAREVVDIRDR